MRVCSVSAAIRYILWGLTLSLISPNALAVTSILTAMKTIELAYTVIAIGGFSVVLLVLAIVLKIRVTKAMLMREDINTQRLRLQAQLDNQPTALCHLDQDGNITFINKVAAYYLGSKAESLTHTALCEHLPEADASTLSQALSSARESVFQSILPARNKHYQIRIAPKQNDSLGYAAAVTFVDVDDYQAHIDSTTQMKRHALNLPGIAKQGLITITGAADSPVFTLSQLTASWLGQSDTETYSMEEAATWFDGSAMEMLKRLLNAVSDGSVFTEKLNIVNRGVFKPVVLNAKIAQHTINTGSQVIHIVITDRSEIVETLQQQNVIARQCKALITNSVCATYLLNSDDQVVDCNREFTQLFGVDSARLKGQLASELRCFSAPMQALHRQIEGLSTKRRDFNLDNGKVIRVHLATYSTAGHKVGSVGFIEDLTQLHNLTAERKAAQYRLLTLLENAPLGITFFDSDERLSQSNPALSKQLGQPQQDVNQLTLSDLFTDSNDTSALREKLDQDESQFTLKAKIRRSGKKALPATAHVTRISEAPLLHALWLEDQSEEAFLRYQFKRLQQYASIPMGVIQDNKLHQLNSAACAFFGVPAPQELLQTSILSETINVDSNNAMLQEKLELVQVNGQIATFQWQHQFQDNVLPCEITLIPLFRDEKLVATLCMWVDLRAVEQANKARIEAIKLRENAEQEMAQKHALLQDSQQRLAQKTQHLEQTEEQLQQAQQDLSIKLETIENLQQAHEDISAHLVNLQDEYEQNRSLLEQSQQANTELEKQLTQSSEKVGRLEKQRNQIAQALQYSESQYKRAQQELEQSEQETAQLKTAQEDQESKVNSYIEQINHLKTSINEKDKAIVDVSAQIKTLQTQLHSSAHTSESLREQLINQRKASELAQQEQRELQLQCQRAEAELTKRSRQLDHLQHEMTMLEQMSQQQRGDMEQHNRQLEQELQAKHEQLQVTEQALIQSKEESENEKQHRAEQQAHLDQLQQELAEVERKATQQQQAIKDADQRWQKQQVALQAALTEKQQALQLAEAELHSTREQTEAEKAAQQAQFEALKAELAEAEVHAQQHQQKANEQDKQWQQAQHRLAQELAHKQANLQQTEARLSEHQQQIEAERIARQQEQDKLEQLKKELQDVESRATKQREMMSGNDQQWRQHHEEIEQQKKQLQHALQSIENQNHDTEEALASSLEKLKSAQEQVARSQQDEKALQEELDAARVQAVQLQEKLSHQEAQEVALRQQVDMQQKSLSKNEQSITQLQRQQAELTEKLQAVENEYAASQASLNQQNMSQSQLQEQLQKLEQELSASQSQLSTKEHALQQAKVQLETNESKLQQQEEALINAQKVELQQAPAEPEKVPDPVMQEVIAQPMPPEPNIWFDLLPYLQNNRKVGSLSSALNSLTDSLTSVIGQFDDAVNTDNIGKVAMCARKLSMIAKTMDSEPLTDMAVRMEADCEQNMVDNITIYWPIARQNLMNSLRVIYSHLQAE